MSFELTTQTDKDGKTTELVEELITTEHTTVKKWTKEQIAKEVTKLQTEIEERQDRIVVLVAQQDKFTKEAK